jgi:hypothetical protein
MLLEFRTDQLGSELDFETFLITAHQYPVATAVELLFTFQYR